MKTQSTTLRIPALLLASALTVLVGCSERAPTESATPDAEPSPTDKISSAAGEAWDATKETATEVYTDVKNATTDAVSRLDRATHDDRADIQAGLADAAAELEAEFAEWRAEGKTIDDTAQAKLTAASTEFKQSLRDLATATASGWEVAKARTAAAWVDLKAAYAAAKGESDA